MLCMTNHGPVFSLLGAQSTERPFRGCPQDSGHLATDFVSVASPARLLRPGRLAVRMLIAMRGTSKNIPDGIFVTHLPRTAF
jgi:hypothetical protein